MQRSWAFQLPTRVQFGRGGARKLGEVAGELGGSAFLVGYGDRAGLEETYARAAKALSDAGLSVTEFFDVPPDPEADDVLGHLPEIIARYKGKKAITAICRDSFFNPAFLRGTTQFLMDMVDNPRLVHELIEVALSHDIRAMQRMVQAGVVPVTWQQVLLEWQRDWARKETYDATIGIVQEHSGAYGMGVDYAYTMVHKAPARGKFNGETLPPETT